MIDVLSDYNIFACPVSLFSKLISYEQILEKIE